MDGPFNRPSQIELQPMMANHRHQPHERLTQSLPLPSDNTARSPTFSSFPLSPSNLKQCPCVIDPECHTELNKPCSRECIRLCIFTFPDLVRWRIPTERVTIERDESGKLGFRFKEVKSKANIEEKYTLVHSVREGSKAVGKLIFGDYILSVNGTPLKNKTLAEIVKDCKDNTITIIKYRPMGLIPRAVSPSMQRSTSVPSPDTYRRATSLDNHDVYQHDSLGSCASSNSENVQLIRQDSDKSKSSSSSHGSHITPSSPDVNIRINFVSPENKPRSKQAAAFTNIRTLNEEPDSAASNERGSQMSRHQLAAVEGEISNILASDMPFLPHLKLIIVGSESEQIAKSLLPRNVSSTSASEVCTKYNTRLAKKEGAYEWSPSQGFKTMQPIVKAVTKAVRNSHGINLTNTTFPSDASEQCRQVLQHVCQDGLVSGSDSEEVELEILALKENALATYCGHVLYTAHSVYIVQFDTDEYFEHRESVLTYIQTEVSKIRTYASDKVQIMLVATASKQLPSADINSIGQTLQENFSGAFANQLHPNSETNLPCYVLHPHNQLNDLSLKGFNRQESCEDNTTPNTTANLDNKAEVNCNGCERSKIHFKRENLQNGHIAGDPTADSEKAFDVDSLKSQIGIMAFQQRFVARKYPYRYLLYQEKKEKVRCSHPVGALRSDILRECKVEDETEQKAMLKYLHDSGDIVCMDYLPYMMSGNLMHHLNFMVLFSRDHLVNATQKLLTIPTRSKQEPAYRTHWDDLQKTALISRPFLLHLLGSDHRLLEIFLDMMNLIYCMDDGLSDVKNGTAPPQYLVPYYLLNQQNVDESDILRARHRVDRILYLDFPGFIPHGMFMRILIQLIGVSEETRGTWQIDSQFAGWVTFANHANDYDCKLEMEFDPLAATIKISAECNMSYSPQNIPALLRRRIMKRLKPTNNEVVYKCGPPCPRLPECHSGQGKRIHVLDVKDGKGPLWCGQKQMDREESVKQWLVEETMDACLPPNDSTEVTYVKKSSHIRHLPPSLYKWICDNLNVGYASGQNWEMLAGVLGYTMADILIWRERRHRATDPCDSMLQDWGRYGTATLGRLMECLDEMERKDLLLDMQEQWHIVEQDVREDQLKNLNPHQLKCN
ncbi:uncharacterized protein [Amphiura filiformis]|uniref:uncharacterized protein n=1 Tax=Amphiura filiformis TaxID=82378 RepID=UPI003B2116C2